MKILVIIVSYNFERWIDRCLTSLRHSEKQADVIVIDNASQDRTVSIIESRFPEVRLIKSKKNLGFGRANNLGMQIALEEGYDAVFLLNQDAWIGAKVLGTLSELSRTYPCYGILSPIHLTGSGKKLDEGFAGYSKLGNLNEAEIQQVINRQEGCNKTEPIPLSFVNAAFWLIPTPILQQIGGFCPLFYHYGEDVDYINRLHRFGYAVGYSPEVFGCHDREDRKVSREAWLRSEQIYLLTEYANINYSFLKAFGYGVLAGIKKAWKALTNNDLYTSAAYIRMTFRLMARTREVLHYRKTNLNNLNCSQYLTPEYPKPITQLLF